MMDELELIDIFRKQYPQKLSFSYESKALKVCSRIYFFLVARSFSTCVANDHRLRWKLIKMEIRGLTIAYSKNKAKRQRKRESDVQTRLEELEERISDSTSDEFINKALNEKEILKKQLLLFYEEKENGLEKRNYSRKKIAELALANGKHLHETDEIMKKIENFYKDLYTSNGDIEDDRFENFVQNLEIPKLQDWEKEELEGEITLEECKEVLKTFWETTW